MKGCAMEGCAMGVAELVSCCNLTQLLATTLATTWPQVVYESPSAQLVTKLCRLSSTTICPSTTTLYSYRSVVPRPS
jgi:hypothetical protein